MGQQQFFTLPNTSIKGIPLTSGGKHLSIDLVEIGCKPSKKRAQLRRSLRTMRQYWGIEYIRAGKVDWQPISRRTMVHYDPNADSERVFNEYMRTNPDVVLFYQTLDEDSMLRLRNRQRKVISSFARRRELWDVIEMLKDKDAKALHTLIAKRGSEQIYSDLRGKFAEFFALNDLYDKMPQGMSLYRNSYIYGLRDIIEQDYEIDGVMTSYGEKPYWNLVKKLDELDHLECLVNPKFKSKVKR